MIPFKQSEFINSTKFLCPVCQGALAEHRTAPDIIMYTCTNYPCNTILAGQTALVNVKITQCPGTRVHYMYRDGGNWKKHNYFDVKGFLDVDAIVAVYCDDDNHFVPEDVGVPSLSPYDEEPTEDDHPWHEITGAEFLQMEPENAVHALEMEKRFEEAYEMGWPSQYL